MALAGVQEPEHAGETPGTQGRGNLPSWGQTQETVPGLAICPLLTMAAGQSPTDSSSHTRRQVFVGEICLRFRVVSKAVCVSCLMSLGHPGSLASPSRTVSSGNVNQFKY